MFLLILFAFLAGIVTILSPCILPVLPIVLSSSIGGVQSKSRPLGVVFGFVASFTFFTLFLASIVRTIGISADTLRLFSIVVIAFFGLSLLIPASQNFIELLFSKLSSILPVSKPKSGFISGVLVGLSLGLLWTPCVGPILASVITLALSGTVTLNTFIITLAYAVGTALPMLIIMAGGRTLLNKVPWLTKNSAAIQKTFGVLMIATAIAIYFNVDRKFQSIILDLFPKYGSGLTKFEDNNFIRDLLNRSNDQSYESNDLEIGQPMDEVLLFKGPRAPELIIGGTWFNSAPLTLAQLRGKVVLIDFWTYTCINCQRTFPYLASWWTKYKDEGLVIIGVHSPEFEFEKAEKNVAKALQDFGINYPVMQDNDFATWRAYKNRYWPAKYILDKDGYIRYTHFGEGDYDETERVIQRLLKEIGAANIESDIENATYKIYSKTPELYLGSYRMNSLISPESVLIDQIKAYTVPKNILNNRFAFEGNWLISGEYSNPQANSKLHLNFESKEVYLVMRSKNGTSKVKVFVDNKLQYFGDDNVDGLVTVTEDTLYRLVKLPTPGRHILRLEFEDNNIEIFAFTFG